MIPLRSPFAQLRAPRATEIYDEFGRIGADMPEGYVSSGVYFLCVFWMELYGVHAWGSFPWRPAVIAPVYDFLIGPVMLHDLGRP